MKGEGWNRDKGYILYGVNRGIFAVVMSIAMQAHGNFAMYDIVDISKDMYCT